MITPRNICYQKKRDERDTQVTKLSGSANKAPCKFQWRYCSQVNCITVNTISAFGTAVVSLNSDQNYKEDLCYSWKNKVSDWGNLKACCGICLHKTSHLLQRCLSLWVKTQDMILIWICRYPGRDCKECRDPISMVLPARVSQLHCKPWFISPSLLQTPWTLTQTKRITLET